MKKYTAPEFEIVMFDVEDGILTDVTDVTAESKMYAMDNILGDDKNNVKVISGVDIRNIGK